MTAPSPHAEVSLVHELMRCRECTSHWNHPRYYGPFPRCHAHELPAALQVAKPLSIASFEQPSPAGLHGCRKAPIMVVGINPNLTGFFTLPEDGRALNGPRAVYPHFADANSYALHHRYMHEDRHEFLMEINDVPKLIDLQATPQLIAPSSGRVQGKPTEEDAQTDDTGRVQSNREIKLRLLLNDGTPSPNTLKWGRDHNLVVLPSAATAEFKQGDVIAGVMTAASTITVKIAVTAKIGSSFYNSIQTLLKGASRGVGHTLRLGEDLSLHDMVACATPGWNEKTYGIDQCDLRKNCVKKNQYTARQIAQSQPALILFAGLDAFEMFLDNFKDDVKPPHDRAKTAAEVIAKGHARYTLSRENWTSHLVIMGHLSYPAMPLNEFSLTGDVRLTDLQKNYADLWALLQTPDYTAPGPTPGSVCLSPVGWAALSASKKFPKAAIKALEDALGDPRPKIIEKITMELLASGALALSTTATPSVGALQRQSADCHFCEAFAIPGGCAYPA